MFEPSFGNLQVPIITGVARSISSEAKENIHKMVGHLESILLQNVFFGGAEVQLSDLSIFCSVGFLYVSDFRQLHS